MNKEVEVVFQPSGRRVFVLPGTMILEAAARAGFIIDSPCGGAGSCGKCRVRITAGELAAIPIESETLGEELVADGVRLACQARVDGPVTIEIPQTSLFENQQRILEHGEGSDLHISPADSIAKGCKGIAFDVGTTTLVGTIVDLHSGEDLAVESEVNPQVSFGDDVISRIMKCREEENGMEELREAVLGSLNNIVAGAAEKAGIAPDEICAAVFAGNTTMQHILCGIDPSPLGEYPFDPPSPGDIHMSAGELGLNIASDADAYIFPHIGGFVGGDTVAGILASRFERIEGAALYIDIGTNGEIAFISEGKMMATSVAAGPAFEGARISCGMRATSGAIEKVVLSDKVEINVIANAKPVGICGTGLVDVAAEMLRAGILDETGRVLAPADAPAGLSDALRERIVEVNGQYSLVLATAEESGTGEMLCIHQQDIRELQLANGAIKAGINILMKTAGVTADQIDTVLVAGAFGNFIRRRNARRIGMLPAISTDRIRYIGNAASFGAKRALLSTDETAHAGKLVADIQHMDLSLDPEFQIEFGDAMMFPGDDVDQAG